MIPFGMTAGAGIGAGTGAPSTQVQPLVRALLEKAFQLLGSSMRIFVFDAYLNERPYLFLPNELR